MAASVDRLEDVPVRRLYGSPPVQLSPKDLDEVGILGKRRRKADAVLTIPRGFDLLQDFLDHLLICCHDCLLNEWAFYPIQATKCQADASLVSNFGTGPLEKNR